MPEKEEPKTPAAKKLSGLLTKVKYMVGGVQRAHDVMGDRNFRERYRALHGEQPPKRSEVRQMRYARRPGDDSALNSSYEPEGNELSEAKKKRITYLHGKQYPKGTHYCATHVEHADWGRGRTITTQHAKPDAYGDIDWYDVMFEHGVEKQVPTDDLNILLGEGHNNHEHHEPSGEEFVYEYLTAFFGTDLNESADDITEEHLIEAIEAINILTGIVNEYFGLSEEKYEMPEGHKKLDSGGGVPKWAIKKTRRTSSGGKEIYYHGPAEKVDAHQRSVARSIETGGYKASGGG